MGNLNFEKYKNRKYMDIIIPVAIAMLLVVFLSVTFIKLIDNVDYWKNGIGTIYSIVSPFIYGIIIAYILAPIMNFFEKRFKLKRGISILLTYIIIIGVLLIIIIYLLPKITSSVIDMVRNIPYYASETEKWIENFTSNGRLSTLINSDMGKSFKPDVLISKVSKFSMTLLNSFLGNVFSITNYFIKWIFGFFVAIYVLFDKEKFLSTGEKLIYKTFKKKNGDRITQLIKTLNTMIGTYIGTKALDSLIIGVIALIGLIVIGSPYTLLIAIAVGVTNMIPYFGPFIGMFIGGLINVFDSPVKALVVVGFLFSLQQFDGWYLDPKLIGDKVGLSPFLVMLAVTLGGGLYGVVGMILSVPVMAVIKIYIDKVFR